MKIQVEYLLGLKPDVWAFDSDGTLYDAHLLEPIVEGLMDQYFAKLYGVSAAQGSVFRSQYKEKHGTRSTVVAINRGMDISLDEFIEATYLSAPLDEIGVCDPTCLAKLVPVLSGKKIILTNAPAAFAKKIVAHLGIGSEFEEILGIHEANFVMKPQREAFKPLQDLVYSGANVVFLDDKLENVKAAVDLGCAAYWFNNHVLREVGGGML